MAEAAKNRGPWDQDEPDLLPEDFEEANNEAHQAGPGPIHSFPELVAAAYVVAGMRNALNQAKNEAQKTAARLERAMETAARLAPAAGVLAMAAQVQGAAALSATPALQALQEAAPAAATIARLAAVGAIAASVLAMAYRGNWSGRGWHQASRPADDEEALRDAPGSRPEGSEDGTWQQPLLSRDDHQWQQARSSARRRASLPPGMFPAVCCCIIGPWGREVINLTNTNDFKFAGAKLSFALNCPLS